MFNRKKFSEWMDEKKVRNCELARKLGISEGAVRHIRTGLKQPSLGMAVEIAQMMGCKLDDLVISEEV
jgi:DNA-binding XRE family transcriptional regulator